MAKAGQKSAGGPKTFFCSVRARKSEHTFRGEAFLLPHSALGPLKKRQLNHRILKFNIHEMPEIDRKLEPALDVRYEFGTQQRCFLWTTDEVRDFEEAERIFRSWCLDVAHALEYDDGNPSMSALFWHETHLGVSFDIRPIEAQMAEREISIVA